MGVRSQNAMMAVSVRPRSSHISEILPKDKFLTMHGIRYCCQKCINDNFDYNVLSCDKNFCSACIEMGMSVGCPLCEEKDSPEIEMSYIQNQRVVGEIETLSKSKADCSFASVEIACSTCKGIVQLDELPNDWDELSVSCQLYQCEYCNQPVPHQEGRTTSSLQDEFQPCVSFPCPHGCGAHVKRALKHEESCPNVVKQCSNYVEATSCETEKLFDRDSAVQEAFSSMQKRLENFDKEMLQTKKEVQELRHEMNAANSVISNLSSELSKTKASNKEMADLLQSELEYFNQPHNSSLKNLSIKCMRVQLALLSDPTSVVLSAKKSIGGYRIRSVGGQKKMDGARSAPRFLATPTFQVALTRK